MKISLLLTCFAIVHVSVGESGEEKDTEPEELLSLEIKIMGQKDPLKIVAGIPFSLSCQIYGAPGQVWWTRNETNLTNPADNSNSTTTLKFQMPNRYDEGSYTCVARETAEKRLTERTVHIRVTEPGKIIAETHYIRVKWNDPATLSCHVQGYPIAYMDWRRETLDGDPVTADWEIHGNYSEYDNTTHKTLTLYFANVTRADGGVYICETSVGDEDISDRIFLKVVVPPQISINFVKAGGPDCVYFNWTVDMGGNLAGEYLFRHIKNGTQEWQLYGTEYSSEIEQSFNMYGLQSGTAYQIEIIIRNFKGDSGTTRSGWVTTWGKNIEFSPTIWIEATTLHSITIGWLPPPPDLREYVHEYRVFLTAPGKILYGTTSVESRKFHFRNLYPGITYLLRVYAESRHKCGGGRWYTAQEIVTKDRDPIFVPTASIEPITTAHSITMTWSGPPPELRDRVHQYKVTATRRGELIKLAYVNGTENSYVFESLTSETSYLFKVAACSDLITQCGNWSTEKEVLTIQRAGGAFWPSVIVAVVLVFSIIIAWMGIRKHREMASRKRFIEETLNHYNNVVLDCLDPELNLADQAQRMSYDKKWEFPRQLLKLDKILGSGAFGIVRKAQAKSICRGESVTTVAVKMVRATASLNYMTALTRELKILAYLGKHLNVVNLLGACTKNVSHGELLVIVEFCRFGNLHDYLRRCRADFVHQSHTSTGNISADSNSSVDSVNANDSGMKTETSDRCPSTDATDTRVADDDALVPVTDSVAPTWPSKYEGDYEDDNMDPICTRDLLCWAWQLARGMKYLGTRRVLHGDLAARNVLLADNNVVKICDFGLSKALHTNENYKEKGHDPLPVKWMAIESIRDRVFSVHSDIWSYGIVLWEFFTLAETPYSGIHAANVYQKLRDGFRLTRPKYASEDIYHIMLRCWDEEPLKRPSFAKLEHSIAHSLDEDVKTHYFNLDSLYIQLNDEPLANESEEHSITEPSEDAVGLNEPRNEIDITSENDAHLTNLTSEDCELNFETFPRPAPVQVILQDEN